LALKVYEFANPASNTEEHLARCAQRGRFHIPVMLCLLLYAHHLVLALNSSVNFFIYSYVSKDFRKRVVALFKCQ